ncbi:Coatomer subunit gamma [Meloidogyne graminicola]|uniref:Coatomer subunit gamma n=1 Tax=Meloidogyne graminicola TaxID=189291 RepID=A0A8S9ZM45_9BILA|nr:Coatomer subunit gamma [Meloidogyne graminicola]
MRRDKKDDEAGAVNPYDHLDKATVVQETRAFNETPINARKCRPILCKLLYLLQHGETIGKTEATDTFFAITKLWQAKDVTLRMLVYLAIKELCTISSDVIIVISSLTKDMTGREDIYRPSAIRALCRILTDTGMLQAIERYMKQAIVDKVPSVSSAALVSSLHLMKRSPDVVRRWANEVQEAVSSDNHMVQFHALSLLYQIRSTDRLAILKMVQKFSKSGLRSPDRIAFQFIESCLRNKHEMVVYEAASAIVRIPSISSGELASAISVLQIFLSSPKSALRFAAVRTLNRISINYPQAVISCNVDLEQLITDQNRSIATLAITTLLKTGAEASVERLMKQIGTFVSEISDEFKLKCLPFKIVVIEAIPIVNTIISIIENNSNAKDLGLSHLCEFIEDCEHPALATKVLHLLGREGPTTNHPARYIRFIYNRVILETTQVRAAAVTALAKFGAECPKLRPNIIILLKRCLLDTDDEVRDRATFYLTILKSEDQAAIVTYILDTLKVSIAGLQHSLEDYVHNERFEEPFDIKQVPLSLETVTEKKPSMLIEEPVIRKETKASRMEIFSAQISAIPEFKKLGPLLKSSPTFDLTKSVTEYYVSCVEHVFNEYILLQFDCRNNVSDQLMEDVYVHLEQEEDTEEDNEGGDINWEIEEILPIKSLPVSKTDINYVLLKIPEDGRIAGAFFATLKFKVRDVDPATGTPESEEFYDDVFAVTWIY